MDKLKEHIDSLDSVEHTQIFAIIKKYNTNFTQTESGVYVSLNTLAQECIDEIQKYIVYCKDQKKHMEEETKRRLKYEAMLK